MKSESHHAMIARWSTRLAICTVCGGLSAAIAPAVESEEYANWIELTVGGFDIKGKDSAFKSRWGSSGDFYGGIESMRYEKFLDDGLFLLEGHALFGMNDFDITLHYERDDVGYVRGGYREFRTWYDSAAGYLPNVPGGWRSPNDSAYELDRGEVWFEAGLRMPDIPEFTLRYAYQWRDGQKDSTIWGFQNFPAPAGGGRGILPAWQDIDESRNLVNLDITHTLGNTDLGLFLRYEGVRNDNVRKADLNTATLSQRDKYEYDLYGGRFTSVTRFDERMMLSFGYSVTSMDTKIDGSNRLQDPFTFNNGPMFVTGGGDYLQNVTNLNFWWMPVDDFVIVPSIRANWENYDMFSNSTPLRAATNAPRNGRRWNSTDWREFNQSLELRYSGIEDLVLYATGDWGQYEGDKDHTSVLYTSQQRFFKSAESSIDDNQYTVGANWYPLKGVSLSTQYQRRSFDQNFDNVIPPPGDREVDAQLDKYKSTSDNFNFRVTWRALPSLTLVSRYDYQQTSIENRMYLDNTATAVSRLRESGDIESHALSQSATWSVSDRLYLQGSLHWITAETSTPASTLSGVQANRHVNWNNDYWSTALSAGYIINKNTDLTASYYYFKADNYVDNTAQTTPYGIISQEHALTIMLTQWVTPQMAWNLRYGFFKGDDDAYGGFNDYEAHMISAGFRYQF